MRDDNGPDARNDWFHRTTEEIAAKKDAALHAMWAALRLPESQARQQDTFAGGASNDVLISGTGQDRLDDKRRAPLDAYQRALLDTIAGTESSGYDVLYSPTQEPRHMRRGADGQPDYSRHPNDAAIISSGPNKGKLSTAAGRYQINVPTWEDLTRTHSDLTDFSPANQDMAAWYLASDTYRRGTGGRDLATDLRDPSRYSRITATLQPRWTSLPGGSEQRQGQDEFGRRMAEGLRKYLPTPSQP